MVKHSNNAANPAPPTGDAGRMSESSYAVLAAALSSLLVGLTVVGTRDIMPRADPLLIAFLRYSPAGLCFLPALWKRAGLIARPDWLPLIALGLMFYGVYPWIFSAALKYTSALHGALVLPLLPLATLALGAMLGREIPTREKLAGIALSILGIGIAFTESLSNEGNTNPGAWKGDLLMVAGILLCAVFNVLSRPYIIRYSALTVTAVTMQAGSVALALLVVLAPGDKFLVALNFSAQDWALVLFLSLGGAALANYLWIFALGRTMPSRVALFAIIPPLVAAILGPLLLREVPSLATFVGLAFVVGGIIIANRGTNPPALTPVKRG